MRDFFVAQPVFVWTEGSDYEGVLRFGEANTHMCKGLSHAILALNNQTQKGRYLSKAAQRYETVISFVIAPQCSGQSLREPAYTLQ